MSCEGTMIGLPWAGERMLFVDIMRTRASTWASIGKGDVDGHLVPVEIRVEGRADQGMKLDGLPLDEDGLEGLDAQAVQGGRPVQHDRVFPDDLAQGFPDFVLLLLHHFLGALDGGHVPLLLQTVVNERFEQLQSHLLGQAALVEAEVRADHDDRAARVVHPFSQKVLTEPPLLSFEHVGKRLQRPPVGA